MCPSTGCNCKRDMLSLLCQWLDGAVTIEARGNRKDTTMVVRQHEASEIEGEKEEISRESKYYKGE